MMTATLATGNRTMETAARPRRSLEELVDRLIEALFKDTETVAPSTARSVHEARRLRQAGDVEGALAVLAGMDTTKAEPHQARWAYAEWTDLVRRRFGDRDALVYSQGTGRAAALVPTDDGGTLEVAAVLGMRWRPGNIVSRRSLRGPEAPGKSLPSTRGRGGVLVVAHAPIAILALKARYQSRDTVEALGVRLIRGRGRVRRGVCPFHDAWPFVTLPDGVVATAFATHPQRRTAFPRLLARATRPAG